MIRWTAHKWEKSNIWCRLFGHTWKDGWHGYQPYVTPVYYATDNTGVEHINLQCRCDRCNQPFTIARMHVQSLDSEMKRVYSKHSYLEAWKHKIT